MAAISGRPVFPRLIPIAIGRICRVGMGHVALRGLSGAAKIRGQSQIHRRRPFAAGKAALVAGAFDERFALVAPAGSGCGGTGAYRFNGQGRGGKEGLEDVVKNFPQWMNPHFAEFSGQVEKLPFDQHWFIGLIAPRLFIAPDGLNDGAASVNALIQSYLAAKPVYALLGVPAHLGINFRPGKHMLAPEDWKAILDFADQQLRKQDLKRRFDQLPPADTSP